MKRVEPPSHNPRVPLYSPAIKHILCTEDCSILVYGRVMDEVNHFPICIAIAARKYAKRQGTQSRPV